MDENLQQQPKKDFLEIDKEEMELDEEAKYEGLDLGLKDLEQEKQKLLLEAKMSYNRFLKKKVEIRLAKIIIEELKEVEENKLRIDKEIEGLEARIAEERECLEYEEWDTIEKRIEPIKKELAEMKKIQKFAEERLVGIKKKKLEEINSKKKETVRVVQLNGEEGLKVLKVIKSFLDKGSDDMHPGPKTHNHYANVLFDYISMKFPTYLRGKIESKLI